MNVDCDHTCFMMTNIVFNGEIGLNEANYTYSVVSGLRSPLEYRPSLF